jgi:hypothetical protein
MYVIDNKVKIFLSSIIDRKKSLFSFLLRNEAERGGALRLVGVPSTSCKGG